MCERGEPWKSCTIVFATVISQDLSKPRKKSSSTRGLRQHHGRVLVNPGSVGLAFKDYVGGRIPTILNHAEYAMIEEFNGAIGVSLRRLLLDKGKLRHAQRDSEHPLGPWLREQYV